MNEEQKKAETDILAIMLRLPWDQREDVWAAITYNEIFCVHCGWGEIGAENRNCQCANDE